MIRKRSMHEAIVGDWYKDRVPEGGVKHYRDLSLPMVRGLERKYEELTEKNREPKGMKK